MNIIVAIEFDSLSEYQDGLRIAAHHFAEQQEAFEYCITRERGLEALTCRQLEVPFIAYAKGSDTVLDTNVDLTALDADRARVLYRARSKYRFDNVLRNCLGLRPLIAQDATHRTEHWPAHMVQPDRFLKRGVSLMTPDAFAEQLAMQTLLLPLFVKTVEKTSEAPLHHVLRNLDDLRLFNPDHTDDWNRVWEKVGDPENAPLIYIYQHADWYCPYRDSMQRGREVWVEVKDNVITSEVMNIAQDGQSDNERKEYRCFIGHNDVISASRYIDYTSLPVPDAVPSFAQAFAEAHADRFGDYYVVDVAELANGELAMIELNPLSHSGRYLDNDPVAFYQHVLAHQAGRLALIEPQVEVPEAKSARCISMDSFAFADDDTSYEESSPLGFEP